MSKGDTTVDDKASDVAEGLKKLLDKLTSEVNDESSVDSKNAVVDELYGAISSPEIADFAVQARSAIDRYRNSMRWLVGAVAAIGAALFGSTAFTDADPFGSTRMLFGLPLASAGLVLILWAASLVFEPEDASLGELAADLEHARRRLGENYDAWASDERAPRLMLKLRPIKSKLSPRMTAMFRLGEIVEGPESTAHLGHSTVKQLIASIGEQTTNSSRKETALSLVSQRRQAEGLRKGLELAETYQKTLLESVGKFEKAMMVEIDDPPVATGASKAAFPSIVAAEIRFLIAMLAKDRKSLEEVTTELQKAQTDLETRDYQLGLDLLHRDLVLFESGVAQLRGKFNLSRRALLCGAILTLTGTMLYISGIKSAADDSNGQSIRIGTMTVRAGTKASDSFEGKPNCLGTPLQVIFRGAATPSLAEKFEITVADPSECRGDYAIPGDRAQGDVELNIAPAVSLAAGAS